ncbi:hypothetical protein D5072_09965 [Dickeya dianthicola]|uniref:Uncharacterized protein n=1 Tax=Dickeya dianthicola TaxID=204039 RepID=A0AAX1C2R3_9GAMM|nr:hypothetical protein DF213_17745 [Dickeya dianthicola]RJL68689.1 hypothetical protein D5072_09965 [Dickeya dianthicola]RJL76316.1 hypothetical protein D5077_01370 [Dickeya dianthicola]
MSCLYPSYFKLQVRWLRSVTRITYLSKLIGIPSLAAFLKLELFWVYTQNLNIVRRVRPSTRPVSEPILPCQFPHRLCLRRLSPLPAAYA